MEDGLRDNLDVGGLGGPGVGDPWPLYRSRELTDPGGPLVGNLGKSRQNWDLSGMEGDGREPNSSMNGGNLPEHWARIVELGPLENLIGEWVAVDR